MFERCAVDKGSTLYVYVRLRRVTLAVTVVMVRVSSGCSGANQTFVRGLTQPTSQPLHCIALPLNRPALYLSSAETETFHTSTC